VFRDVLFLSYRASDEPISKHLYLCFQHMEYKEAYEPKVFPLMSSTFFVALENERESRIF